MKVEGRDAISELDKSVRLCDQGIEVDMCEEVILGERTEVFTRQRAILEGREVVGKGCQNVKPDFGWKSCQPDHSQSCRTRLERRLDSTRTWIVRCTYLAAGMVS